MGEAVGDTNVQMGKQRPIAKMCEIPIRSLGIMQPNRTWTDQHARMKPSRRFTNTGPRWHSQPRIDEVI
jgi:hypothetical protein